MNAPPALEPENAIDYGASGPRSGSGPSRARGGIMPVLAAMPIRAKIGLVVIFVYAVLAVAAPILAPYGQAQIVGDQFDSWSSAHLLGTDNLGRDMLSRLIYGAQNTIGIAITTTILAFLVGGMGGLYAAATGGRVDYTLSRLVDVVMAIPQLIFALFLLTIFGVSIPVLIAVIATLDSTRVFRLTRALGMNIMVMDYVEAARLRGEGKLWIMLREIVPNITAPLVAEFGMRFCFVFLLISSLSFLGLGIQPPLADWGSMVRDNATLISYADPTPLLPALAIAILAVAVNYVVDWVLDLSHTVPR